MDIYALWGSPIAEHDVQMTPTDIDSMFAVIILSIGIPILTGISLYIYYKINAKQSTNTHKSHD